MSFDAYSENNDLVLCLGDQTGSKCLVFFPSVHVSKSKCAVVHVAVLGSCCRCQKLPHSLRGWKPHTWIAFQFSEVTSLKSITELKSKCQQARPLSFWRLWGRIHCLALSSVYRMPAFLGSWPPLSVIKAISEASSNCSRLRFWPSASVITSPVTAARLPPS